MLDRKSAIAQLGQLKMLCFMFLCGQSVRGYAKSFFFFFFFFFFLQFYSVKQKILLYIFVFYIIFCLSMSCIFVISVYSIMILLDFIEFH